MLFDLKTLVPALCIILSVVQAKADGTGELEESGDMESSEKLGPVITGVYRHPYTAAVLRNTSYACSAVILNTNWILALSKCFEPKFTSTYVSHKKMEQYMVRAGSSYNHKGGVLYKIITLVNNFEHKVSVAKLERPLVLGGKINAVTLPRPDEEVALGYLASIMAWTPDGHMRVVNVPVIDPAVCEDGTKLPAGHYVCVGGVQDPDRNCCRKDNGGAVIQNNTLIAIATFYQTCALYTRPHSFPKVASFSHWLNSVIWDESHKPTTMKPTTAPSKPTTDGTVSPSYYMDPSKFMLTLPYDPINLPLQPGEDNLVLPRISLYESYLQNLARAKTSTTRDPHDVMEEDRVKWLKKYGKAVMMMPPEYMQKKLDNFNAY